MALIMGVQYGTPITATGGYSSIPAGTILPCGHGIPITSISATSPAVVTTTLNHNLVSGDLVVITGTSTTPSTLNTYTVTVTGNTTFTIPVAVTVAGGAAGVVSKIPPRMLLCDGQSYLRADYPTLFAVIGTSFGSANINSFNVPDFRGRFLRGVDGTAARDPNSVSRTAMNTGGNSGNNVGSVQSDALQGHRHANDGINYLFGTSGLGYQANNGPQAQQRQFQVGDPTNDGTNGVPRTSSETRPINANVNYCIAF